MQSLEQTATAMNEMSSTVDNESQSVGQIVDVIEDIAEQTDLLALNAAIEAARAGEQGRGFAVVADEVRNLASRTQTSTAQIQELISKLQEEAARSVEVMQENEKESKAIFVFSKQATSALETIQSSVSQIQDMNSHIATAAEEQSVVASQINESVTDLNVLAGKTQEGSLENKELAGRLRGSAERLEEQVNQFKF